MTDLVPETVVDLDALADGEPAATAAGGPDVLDAVDEQLIDRLVGRARQGGLQLTGEGGLLAQLTKRLVESALEGELTGSPRLRQARRGRPRWPELPQRA